MAKVSVIIPSYNRRKYIGESIQSVLDQTYRDFEVIVVDDGSTDGTEKVIKSFKDKRIKYIYQNNSGVCIARNTGFKYSTGDYIIFLDSDDVLFPSAIENEIRVLDENPDVGLVFGLKESMNESGHVFSRKTIKHRPPGIWPGTKQILNLFYYNNYIIPSKTMIRKKAIIDAGLFNPRFSSGSEDFDLWVRIAKKYAISHIRVPVVKWRTHTDSISGSQKFSEHIRNNRYIYASFFKDKEIGHHFIRQKPKAYFHLHLRFASFAYDRKQINTARRYLLKALKIRPLRAVGSSYITWVFIFLETYTPEIIIRILRGMKLKIKKQSVKT